MCALVCACACACACVLAVVCHVGAVGGGGGGGGGSGGDGEGGGAGNNPTAQPRPALFKPATAEQPANPVAPLSSQCARSARALRRRSLTDAENDVRVKVPLHQRLQMIKTMMGCSNSEARRLLWAKDGSTPVNHWEEVRPARRAC